jgi:hypothetical protein
MLRGGMLRRSATFQANYTAPSFWHIKLFCTTVAPQTITHQQNSARSSERTKPTHKSLLELETEKYR